MLSQTQRHPGNNYVGPALRSLLQLFRSCWKIWRLGDIQQNAISSFSILILNGGRLYFLKNKKKKNTLFQAKTLEVKIPVKPGL